MLQRNILFELREANNSVSNYVNSRMHNDDMKDMTMIQGRIIKFLYDYDDEDTYQKDIEALLAVRRSTATTILQCMEKNGLITRSSVSSDARLKKLCLTDKARGIHDFIGSQIEATEECARSGLTEEELSCFFKVLDKVKSNLKAGR